MVPEVNVTHVDTKTLSGAEGWQVEAAARAAKAGWAKEKILALLERISAATDTIYTLATLRYLIHGGRINHLKGLLAQVLNIKPLIGVEKSTARTCNTARRVRLKRRSSNWPTTWPSDMRPAPRCASRSSTGTMPRALPCCTSD